MALELPAGWKATPASVPLELRARGRIAFGALPVTAPRAGQGRRVHAARGGDIARTGNEKFSNGYQEIEYPHVERRQVIKPAEIALKVVDVKTAPESQRRLHRRAWATRCRRRSSSWAPRLTYIDQDELAWGDLSKHDVIITGVRAYERRADLRAYNRRLLDYVERGGTVIVQYNKTEFNRADYGPYPAKVSGNRVTDETAPVKVLAPADPVFNFPNKIGPATWADWVQERGLYFLGEKDPKYVDLVSMTDSFKDNPGEKLGSLVEGQVRQGPVDLSRSGAVASTAGRNRRRVPVTGQPDQPAEGAGRAGREARSLSRECDCGNYSLEIANSNQGGNSMRTLTGLAIGLMLIFSLQGYAQEKREGGKVGGGYVPPRGPARGARAPVKEAPAMGHPECLLPADSQKPARPRACPESPIRLHPPLHPLALRRPACPLESSAPIHRQSRCRPTGYRESADPERFA